MWSALCGSKDFTATWSGAHDDALQLKRPLEKCLDDPACVLKEILPGATWQGVYAKITAALTEDRHKELRKTLSHLGARALSKVEILAAALAGHLKNHCAEIRRALHGVQNKFLVRVSK